MLTPTDGSSDLFGPPWTWIQGHHIQTCCRRPWSRWCWQQHCLPGWLDQKVALRRDTSVRESLSLLKMLLTRLFTFEVVKLSNKVLTLLNNLVLTCLPTHPKVSEVPQSKTPHFFPRVPIGPDNSWVVLIQISDQLKTSRCFSQTYRIFWYISRTVLDNTVLQTQQHGWWVRLSPSCILPGPPLFEAPNRRWRLAHIVSRA